MPQVAVTDTHALIWHALGRHRKLGRRARDLFGRADVGRAAVYVPALVLVEVLEAARRGAIVLPDGADGWVERLDQSGSYFLTDLTAAVVLRGHSLYAIPERTDRLIAATAAVHDLPLITRDPTIAAAASVPVLWS